MEKINKTVLVEVHLEGSQRTNKEYNDSLKAAMKEVEDVILTENSQGYKVLSVTPLTGCESEVWEMSNYNGGSGWGYGYSFTTGILIVFEKTDF